MRVLVAGTFAADYSRNRILIRLLERGGLEVRIVRYSLWGNRRHALLDEPKWRLVSRAALVYPRLFAKVLFARRADVIFVLYPGQLDLPIVKLAAWLRRTPVVLDLFILLEETAVSDRGLRNERSFTARALAYADRIASRHADLVLADTPSDARHFANATGTPLDRFRVLWVGAQEDVFRPLEDVQGDPRQVFFHGTYIPLHGIETIVRAAKLLERDRITVTVLGDGQARPAVERLVHELEIENLRLRDSVPLEQLPAEIARAAVCLGIFGTTPKADRVVPNKVFEYLAVGCPVITADTTAIGEAFADGEVVTVPPGDPTALAEAIRSLVEDPVRAASIAAAGHARYRRDYSEEALTVLLSRHLRELRHR